MDLEPDCEEQGSQSDSCAASEAEDAVGDSLLATGSCAAREPSAGPSTATPVSADMAAAVSELQEKRSEEARLTALVTKRRQVLESLQKRFQELKQQYNPGSDLFHKYVEVSQAVKKVERERQEILQKEEELEKLKETHAQLEKRKQEQEDELQRSNSYWVKVLKATMFEDIDSLMAYVERLLHTRDTVSKKHGEVQDLADRVQTALVSLEDEHRLIQLKKTQQISQLQSELDETMSEALKWERTWDQIREMRAEKSVIAEQIMREVLTLYKMAGGKFERGGISVTDTEKQLDTIKVYIQHHQDILKIYQRGLEQDRDKEKTEMTKKPSGASQKKH